MSEPLIDVNVSLGQWPTRRVTGDSAPELVKLLQRHGVVEAWAGSFEGVFHNDLAAANTRLVEDCRRHTEVRLLPFGAINPLAPDWETQMRACSGKHAMRGIRLYPGYHGYPLTHPEFARVMRAAAQQSLVVQLVALLEDERMMHPLLRAPAVDLQPLAEAVRLIAGLRLVLLNAMKRAQRGPALDRLLAAGDVSVEIAMLEGVGGVERLLDDCPLERVLFGSHAPCLYIDAAVLKLRESELNQAQRKALCESNARRLIPVT